MISAARKSLIFGVATAAIAIASAAHAQPTYKFDVPGGPLSNSIRAFGRITGQNIVFDPASVHADYRTAPLKGQMTAQQALDTLLSGSRITVLRVDDRTLYLAPANAAPAPVRKIPVSTRAVAQPSAPPPPAAADEPAMLEDIVVTARKRVENLREVPVAVQAVGGDSLVEKNIVQLPELVSLVPNFRISFATSSPFSLIRGFGSGSSLSFEQSVGKFVDNVSYGRDQDARIPIFDVDRVEVLKGPQVLVFGNSTTAGAISIVTRKPGDEFAADASVGYEFNAEEVTAQGGMTIPMRDWASLRIAGLYNNQEKGWVENPLKGTTEPRNKNYAGRATLRLTPTEQLEVLLKAEFDRVRNVGSTLETITQPANPLARFPEINRDQRRNVNNTGAPFFSEEFASLNNETYQADINYDVLGGTLSSITAWREMRFLTNLTNGSNLPMFNVPIGQEYSQASQELRFSGSYGPLDLTVGGYYQHDELRSFTFIELNLATIGLPPARGGFPFGNLYLYDHDVDSYSVFADLTYHLTPSLSISAGARYTETEKVAAQSSSPADILPGLNFDFDRRVIERAVNFSPAYVAAAINGARAIPHSFRDLTLKEHHLQPQVVVQYEFIPENMAYVKYVKGAKAGGFDQNYGLATRPEPFLPEDGEAFEVGIKGLIWDNRLEYSVVAFRETFTNLQTSVFQNAVTIVSNIGEARSQGVEVDLSWAPARGLKVGFNGAYLDAEYVDFPGAACTIEQTLRAPAGTTCLQDRSGTPTQLSSKWTGTLSVEYDRPVLDGRYLMTAGASLFGRSSYNPSTTNDPIFQADGYSQLDAHIDLRPVDGPWTVSLFGRNLTDYHYIDYATTTTLLTGGGQVSSARGRQLGVRLSAQF